MLYNNAHEHAHAYKCTQLTDLKVSSSQKVKQHLEKTVQVPEAHVFSIFLDIEVDILCTTKYWAFCTFGVKIYQNDSTSYDGHGYLLEVNLRNLVQIE